MTDITDQDRRAARQWAEAFRGEGDPGSYLDCAVRYILATVDAPAPTLAEEIMDLGRALDQYGHFDALGIDVAALADRVKQVEEERDEARKRATANLRAVDAVRAQRDEARAEVEHLTAERQEATMRRVNERWTELPVRDRDWLDKDGLPDPADVKPGESWLVRYHSDTLPALRRIEAPGDWYIVRHNGTGGNVRSQDITLVSRLVPTPRVIANPDELDHLAATSIIRDGRGWPGRVTDQGVIMINGFCLSDEDVLARGPVTVLWEPGA